MKLEKFVIHTWPEGIPQFFLCWFPDNNPESKGIYWGPISERTIRDDIENRIISFDVAMDESAGDENLPDARYKSEKGLTSYY